MCENEANTLQSKCCGCTMPGSEAGFEHNVQNCKHFKLSLGNNASQLGVQHYNKANGFINAISWKYDFIATLLMPAHPVCHTKGDAKLSYHQNDSGEIKSVLDEMVRKYALLI